MTCIVGLIDSDGVVHMAADSQSSDGWDGRRMAYSKIVAVGEGKDLMLIGVGGSSRLQQLIQFQIAPSLSVATTDNDRKYINDFAEALRVGLTEHKYSRSDDGQAKLGGTLLVGYHGALYQIADDYAVDAFQESYSAIGVGRDYALGAFHALGLSSLGVLARLRAVMSAAAKFSNGVSAPFSYASTCGLFFDELLDQREILVRRDGLDE